MELRDYLRVLRRRWALIVATTLIALTAAAFVTYQATPQYTSTARVFISTAPSDADSAYQGGLFSQQRVSSYADLVTGLELTERVVDSLDLDISAEDLSQRITASVVPDTVLLSISVTDPDPVLAQRITNATVSELSDFVKDLETPAGAKRALIKATVIDPARLPDAPSSPNPVRNLGLALVLGLLVGFGLALLRELLDTSVKTEADAEAATGAPVLGGIGYDSEASTDPLVSSRPSHAPLAEAFRVLRTNVQFLDVDNHSKVFAVTSAMPAEGKSTTAANLAISLSQSGQRVLLVDGDLRRPQVAKRLGLEGGVGLTTILLGKVGLDDAVQTFNDTNLTVLASGATPPNPAELLQSHAMADLVKQMRDSFDVVIIDSPPLLPVTDAALLAAITDGAILVVRHGSTSRDQLEGAVDRLRSVGAAPLGVVLNRVPRKQTGTGYGYGYGYAPETSTDSASRETRKRARHDRKQERKARKLEARGGARKHDPSATPADPTPEPESAVEPQVSEAHLEDLFGDAPAPEEQFRQDDVREEQLREEQLREARRTRKQARAARKARLASRR